MGKIITQEEAIKISQENRRKGHEVGFTHGVFDIFHIGHMLHLDESKDFCDILIIGIDPDSYAKEVKGEGRPIFSQKERMDIISAHRNVDYVFPILETPGSRFYEDLYKEMRPSTIIIGENHGARDIVRKRVENFKETTLVVAGETIVTTSEIIERIMKVK